MPETRKHRVEARDELDRALFAALGEPARPVTPGTPASDPAATSEPTTERATTGRPPTFVTPGTSLGGFTYGRAKPPAKA